MSVCMFVVWMCVVTFGLTLGWHTAKGRFLSSRMPQYPELSYSSCSPTSHPGMVVLGFLLHLYRQSIKLCQQLHRKARIIDSLTHKAEKSSKHYQKIVPKYQKLQSQEWPLDFVLSSSIILDILPKLIKLYQFSEPYKLLQPNIYWMQ